LVSVPILSAGILLHWAWGGEIEVLLDRRDRPIPAGSR
jgi:hypothetical protein